MKKQKLNRIFIFMKKSFESLINNLSKDELELLFGVGSKIIINSIKYSTNNKCFTIDCKLLTTNPELCIDTFPDGLNHLALESWEYVGYNEKINLLSTLDLK